MLEQAATSEQPSREVSPLMLYSSWPCQLPEKVVQLFLSGSGCSYSIGLNPEKGSEVSRHNCFYCLGQWLPLSNPGLVLSFSNSE